MLLYRTYSLGSWSKRRLGPLPQKPTAVECRFKEQSWDTPARACSNWSEPGVEEERPAPSPYRQRCPGTVKPPGVHPEPPGITPGLSGPLASQQHELCLLEELLNNAKVSLPKYQAAAVGIEVESLQPIKKYQQSTSYTTPLETILLLRLQTLILAFHLLQDICCLILICPNSLNYRKSLVLKTIRLRRIVCLPLVLWQ